MLELLLAFGINEYYHNTLSQLLESRADAIVNTIEPQSESYTNKEYNTIMRTIVQDFADKNKMELMLINKKGNIAITSSGFIPETIYQMPDLHSAKIMPNKRAFSVATLPDGENIMALSVLLPDNPSEYLAIRFVVSLEKINNQVAIIVMLFALIGIGIIIFVIFSSSYFIRSIVIPIGEVANFAKKIADGNFNIRLKNRNNDEIGALCETINEMAAGLAATENMKNDFISSVSHELRTPLTAIKGWGETLATCSPEDTEMFQKGLRVIVNETTRLSGMVEELLDFSRLQSKKLSLSVEKIDIAAELCDAVLMFTERAKREKIELTFEQDEDVIPIAGDKNRLKQVFVNLIDNALKYSDPGDSVTISSYADNDFYTIIIADTGTGISDEDLPNVKKKFYKGNSTRRGSGIGLAVAEELITLHDGTLQLESKLGVGTTVTIKLKR